jgi:RNA-directed DNA polymerase
MKHLRAKLGATRASKLKVNVIRYADDFVITGASQELLETEIKPWVEAFLQERGLRLSAAKTRIVHIDQGFDFVGWNFRKYDGKLLIKPSKKNVKAFYEKLCGVIGKSFSWTQEKLIRKLNPMLRGWAQYHRPVVAKKAFSNMESQLYWWLMRWAKRRHPTKNAKWIRQKYWRSIDRRNWVFAVDAIVKDDEDDVMELYRLSSTAIQRHKKIKGSYNPYDSEDELYGESLRQSRMVNNMRYRKEWVKLYADQRGLCALCGCVMDLDTGWQDHHIIYRVDGGSNALGNRVLLHPNCHAQVHSLNLKIVKPALV